MASDKLTSDFVGTAAAYGGAGSGAVTGIYRFLDSFGPQGLGLWTNQERWESLKTLVMYSAQQFPKGSKAQY